MNLKCFLVLQLDEATAATAVAQTLPLLSGHLTEGFRLPEVSLRFTQLVISDALETSAGTNRHTLV